MSNLKKLATIVGFGVFSLALNSVTHAAPAPLSCEVLMLLTGTTAVLRDQGVSRNNTPVARNSDQELTKKEIKLILDEVYVHGKNKTPDQIKDSIYYACKSARR